MADARRALVIVLLLAGQAAPAGELLGDNVFDAMIASKQATEKPEAKEAKPDPKVEAARRKQAEENLVIRLRYDQLREQRRQILIRGEPVPDSLNQQIRDLEREIKGLATF